MKRSLAMFWVFMILAPGFVWATTYHVNSTRDVADNDTVTRANGGTCSTGTTLSSGLRECTLRAAIQSANYSSGADTIVFDSDYVTSPICLTLTGSSENAAATGDLDITDDLTITGNGARTTIIDGGSHESCSSSLGDRIFQVYSGAATVTIENLTISGGGVLSDNGGGIYVRTGEVTLDEVNLEDNTADSGGGIYLGDGPATIVHVTNSSIASNTCQSMGCGIYNDDATLYVVNSTVFSNSNEEVVSSSAQGGGVHNSDSALSGFYNSVLAFNAASSGGGLYNDVGTIILSNAILSDNVATASADCYSSGGTLTLSGVNLIADTTDCESLTADFSNHHTGTAQGWASADYGDHGGETDTLEPDVCGVSLYSGSGCVDQDGAALLSDQRGTSYGETYNNSYLSSCPIGPYAVAEGNPWYIDDDSDGYGDGVGVMVSCTQPSGYVSNDDDCDDVNPASYPDATEVCDSVDNDCDGEEDEGSACTVAESESATDGTTDSTTESTPSSTLCSDGTLDSTEECDDGNTTSGDGCNAECGDEYCGDGIVNNNDGGSDHPVEVCDDGNTSDDDDCSASCEAQTLYYRDRDGDGYGDATQSGYAATQPANAVTNALDCDDTNSAIYPEASEVCDGADNNCDDSTDEGFSSCNGTAEVCDGLDNNADGQVDEGVTTIYYADTDGDGYGSSDAPVSDCDLPPGASTNDYDCNDGNSGINVAVIETCGDGIDQNCDDLDEACENATDTDDDDDGVLDESDNCSLLSNDDQLDTDADGQGNVCDSDDDGDSVIDLEDGFSLDATESVDTDDDGVGDNSDVFPTNAAEAYDTDNDGVGNEADSDDDGDDIPDTLDDSDSDGVGDADDSDPTSAGAPPPSTGGSSSDGSADSATDSRSGGGCSLSTRAQPQVKGTVMLGLIPFIFMIFFKRRSALCGLLFCFLVAPAFAQKPFYPSHPMTPDHDNLPVNLIQYERTFFPNVTAVEKWRLVATVLEPGNFAPSVVPLAGGGWRMYFNDRKNKGVSSALSKDGIAFAPEAGVRLADAGAGQLDCTVSHAWVIPTDSGFRMYYQGNSLSCGQVADFGGVQHEFRIFSAFSRDGLSFQREGLRLDIGDKTGFSVVAHGRTLKLSDGTYRQYFSANPMGKTGPADIYGASSPDGLQWTVDKSVALERGHDPTVIVVDGKIRMYTAFLSSNTLHLESADGRAFTPVSWMEFYDPSGQRLAKVSDIDVIRIAADKLLIYGTSKGSGGIQIFEKW